MRRIKKAYKDKVKLGTLVETSSYRGRTIYNVEGIKPKALWNLDQTLLIIFRDYLKAFITLNKNKGTPMWVDEQCRESGEDPFKKWEELLQDVYEDLNYASQSTLKIAEEMGEDFDFIYGLQVEATKRAFMFLSEHLYDLWW